MKKLISVLLVSALVLTNFQGWDCLREVELFKKFDLFQGVDQSYAYDVVNVYGDFKYGITNGEASILTYLGSEREIVIPSEINGCPVTSIGSNSFSNESDLVSVTIPDTVTSIGSYAFSGCTGLANIKMSNSITNIEGFVFFGCSNLRSISIPDTTTNIGEETFRGCKSLKTAKLSENLKSIKSKMFYECSSLESVIIPDSVTSIGVNAFEGCSNLKNVKLSESLKFIEANAFSDCSSLEEIFIPNSVTNIEEFAFAGCNNLKTVKLSNSLYSISDYLFSGCSSIEEIVIPDSVTSIGSYSFKGCTNLKKIIIPKSVVSIEGFCIGEGTVFVGCGNLVIYVYEDSYAYEYFSKYGFSEIKLIKPITITGENYPTELIVGDSFKLTGTISSSYKLTSVTVQVLDQTGEEVSTASKTVYPNTEVYSDISSGIKFETLPVGNYTYKVIATDESGATKILINQAFTVKPAPAEKIGVTTNSLNVRKGPSTDYSIIGNLPEGVNIKILEVDSSTGWYKIKYGSGYGYVSYKYVRVEDKEVASTLGITGENYPTTISQGCSFKLTGKISSNYEITTVKVQVLDQYGNQVSTASKVVYPNTYTYSDIDSGIKFGTLPVGYYTYQVIATDESGTTKILVDKDFEVVKPVVSVGNITNLKYTSTTSTETLSWSRVSNASGYEVWMYKSSVGDYAKVKTITSGSTTSYKRSSLTSATMYRYKVRAYRTVNGVKYYGNFTDEFITGTKPLTPSITLSSTQKGKIRITWSNISKKTTGYQIYRATSRYGTYTRIATIEDGNIARSYTNSGRTSKKTYYYKVRAYRTLDNGKKVYSSYSTVKYIKCK